MPGAAHRDWCDDDRRPEPNGRKLVRPVGAGVVAVDHHEKDHAVYPVAKPADYPADDAEQAPRSRRGDRVLHRG